MALQPCPQGRVLRQQVIAVFDQLLLGRRYLLLPIGALLTPVRRDRRIQLIGRHVIAFVLDQAIEFASEAGVVLHIRVYFAV